MLMRKKLLSRLSVFRGGWTLDAAEQVCVKQQDEFDVLNALSDLIDKSLVVMDGSGNEARYHLLETTRQYAFEKLLEVGESEMLHNQHLAYFAELAEKGNKEITGPRQAEVIDLLDAELDNFRAALEWCVSNHYVKSALQMLGALGWAWDMRGYYNEVRSWFEKIRVLEDPSKYTEAYARLLNHLGRFAADFDHRPDAESILEESRALWLGLGKLGEYGLADVLCFLGMNAMIRGEVDKAEPFYIQCHELAKKCNNQRVIAASTRFLGDVQWARGNLPQALKLYEQSLQYSQSIGDLLIISIAAGQLGNLFLELGNYEKARPLFEQELKINEGLHFRFGLANSYIGMCDLYRRQGDYIEAEQWLEKRINVSRDLGMKDRLVFDLYFYGLLALYQKDYVSATTRFKEYFDFDRALNEEVSLCRFFTSIAAIAAETNQAEQCAKLFGAAQAAIERTPDFQIDPFDRAEFDRHIQIARGQLGNARFEALASEGRTMSIEQAIELASKTKID